MNDDRQEPELFVELNPAELLEMSGGSVIGGSNDSIFALPSSPADLVSGLNLGCDCGGGCYVDFSYSQ